MRRTPPVPPSDLLLLFLSLLLAAAPPPAESLAFSPEVLDSVLVQLGLGPDYYAAAAASAGGASAALLRSGLGGRWRGRSDEGRDAAPSRGSALAPLPGAVLPRAVYDDTVSDTPGASSIRGRLELTPAEQRLIRLLSDVRSRYVPRTTVRIAGGWVRDKLLYGPDTPSRDVDLVLSDVSGVDFANLVCRYLIEECPPDCCDFVDSLQAVSKGGAGDRLESASLSLLGFDVDFARLRSETYSDGSRVPTAVERAGCVEDAWRRDLTVNALYYNLNTDQVEDWTERGVVDLVLQNIRTPRDPYRTLLEDPTRALRAVRFASQLSFNVDPRLLRAMKNTKVKDALVAKVSRDAVGTAVDEMLGPRARDPAGGMRLLIDTGLADAVFPLSLPVDSVSLKETGGSLESGVLYGRGQACLGRAQSVVTRAYVARPDLEWDAGRKRLLWYASFLRPVRELDRAREEGVDGGGVGNRGRKDKKDTSLRRLLVALRRPKADMKCIESILDGAESFRPGLWDDLGAASRADARWEYYTLLKPVGSYWREALVLSLATSGRDASECAARYVEVVSYLEGALRLGPLLRPDDGGRDATRPMLDGTRVKGLLPDIDGGGFRAVADAMEEWQVKNVWDYDDGCEDMRRKELEGELADYLVESFGRYIPEPEELS